MVRSGPDSSVSYNAFDPRLQLWVAACRYRGGMDVQTLPHGPLDEATADAISRECRRLGTAEHKLRQLRVGSDPGAVVISCG